MVLLVSQLAGCIYVTERLHIDKPGSPSEPATQPATTPTPAITVHGVEFGLDRIWLDLEIRDADTEPAAIQLVATYDGFEVTLTAAELQESAGDGVGWLELEYETDCGFDIDIGLLATDPDGNSGDTTAVATLPQVGLSNNMGLPPFASCETVEHSREIGWIGATTANVFHSLDDACTAWIENEGVVTSWDFGGTTEPEVSLSGVDEGADCSIAVLHR